MDEIIDRMLTIIQAVLPGNLTKVTSHYSASDVINFGVPLTLAAPSEYLHGKQFSFSGLPSLQIYSDTFTSNDYAEGHLTKDIHKFYLELYFRADFSNISNRMIRRYAWALYKTLRHWRFQKLKDATGKDDYAQDVRVKGTSFETGFIKTDQGDVLFNVVKIDFEAVILTYLIDKMLVIND